MPQPLMERPINVEESQKSELIFARRLRLREAGITRYQKFSEKKREQGYNRKSFWLRIDKGSFDILIKWLRDQEPSDLKNLIVLLNDGSIKCRDILRLHYISEKN